MVTKRRICEAEERDDDADGTPDVYEEQHTLER